MSPNPRCLDTRVRYNFDFVICLMIGNLICSFLNLISSLMIGTSEFFGWKTSSQNTFTK